MSDLLPQDPPELSRGAVLLLTAIRDHLDIPAYRDGDKKARQDYRQLLEIRHADVVALLGGLLAVTDADATEGAAHLQQLGDDPAALYDTAGGDR